MAVADDIGSLDAERVFAAFHRRLQAFVARLVRNPADRDDVIQEVYLRVHRGVGRLRSQERIAPWLFQVARSAATDHHRRNRSRPASSAGLPGDESPAAAADHESRSSSDSAEAMAACVGPMLAALPAADQEAARMTDVDGLTQREAALRAGVTLTAMKSRVQRSRAKLRRLLADCCHLELDRRGRVVGHEPRRAGCPACGGGSGGRRRGG